jgi:hypothetical protein
MALLMWVSNMTGPQIEALCDALCDALTQNQLDMLLRIRLEKSRERLVGTGDLGTVAFKLIEAAERGGWIGDLICAALDWVPGNAMLRKFAEENPELIGPLRAPTEGNELQVTATLNMHPLPTVIYHLLDPLTEPLVRVVVSNQTKSRKRVCLKVFLEELSAQTVRTINIGPEHEESFSLLPTLLPNRLQSLTELQRSTLHVVVEDLAGRTESHDTFLVVCLPRTAGFEPVRSPATGELVDLSHYYGAWVTPYAECVQERIRQAARWLPEPARWGYHGDRDSVTRQVEALYQSLREAGMVHANTVIARGAPDGMLPQRTRLPRESLALKAANCIDGTVLMASLLEGASLSAALVLVPGHAFVGWETEDNSDEWRFLETTVIGTVDFAAACQFGQKVYDVHQKTSRSLVKIHKIRDLRARGIFPLE